MRHLDKINAKHFEISLTHSLKYDTYGYLRMEYLMKNITTILRTGRTSLFVSDMVITIARSLSKKWFSEAHFFMK